MMNLLKPIGHKWESLSHRSRLSQKRLYQFFQRTNARHQKTILFIIGCQRSGTTLMTQIFERDLNASVYGEFSTLSSGDSVHKIRLNPLPLVKAEINKERVPLVVLKPLVETQNVLKLLDYFENSKALWMYRDYRKVALSTVRKWGANNAINNLYAIVRNAPENWRSENISENTRRLVIKHFSENMDPHDAAALFWLVRNRLFFELGLDHRSNVMMSRYEDLLSNPAAIVKGIYQFVGCRYPSDKILVDIHSESQGRRANIGLAPQIESLCEDLLQKLDSIYTPKSLSMTVA